LAFQKPKLGCSYPRTKGAEDFTRTIFSLNFSEPWKFLRKLFKMSTLKIIIFLFVSPFIIANNIIKLAPRTRKRRDGAFYNAGLTDRWIWPKSDPVRGSKKNLRKLSKMLKMK
jgi:hypothetical protein